MNKVSILLIIAIGLMAFSFTILSDANAVTDKRSGVDVYVLSKPSKDYDVIDSGKVTVLMDCNEIINKAVKKAAGDKADGVIIYWETGRYESRIRYK